MQDFSQLPSKTVTEVLMLEVSGNIFFYVFPLFFYTEERHNIIKIEMSLYSFLSHHGTDENGTSSKNISHIRLSTFYA
jgi:hypothetical protein